MFHQQSSKMQSALAGALFLAASLHSVNGATIDAEEKAELAKCMQDNEETLFSRFGQGDPSWQNKVLNAYNTFRDDEDVSSDDFNRWVKGFCGDHMRPAPFCSVWKFCNNPDQMAAQGNQELEDEQPEEPEEPEESEDEQPPEVQYRKPKLSPGQHIGNYANMHLRPVNKLAAEVDEKIEHAQKKKKSFLGSLF